MRVGEGVFSLSLSEVGVFQLWVNERGKYGLKSANKVAKMAKPKINTTAMVRAPRKRSFSAWVSMIAG